MRVLQQLADAQLLKGRTLGIDATTLEANAALRSIVRRDTEESYEAVLTRLAEVSGITTPTRAELARFDRTRKKKGSNDDWTHPQDPDAKITKMKDGRTHLTLVETLITAADHVEAALSGDTPLAEIVADKGYHSNQTLTAFVEVGLRSYILEPDLGRRNWQGKPAAQAAGQPSTDSGRAWATAVAAARRTARTAECTSL